MSNSRIFYWVIIPLIIISCKTVEEPPEPRKEVIVRQMDIELTPNSEPYGLDIDSNGFDDYRLLVSSEFNQNRSKAIFRIEGQINGIWTAVIHSKLYELTEEQQCDVLYPSVLETEILSPDDTIGNNLDDDWYLVGDFHHHDFCFGNSCVCHGLETDVEFLPLTAGTSGYVGIRFIRRARKHFGWIEIERGLGTEPNYIIRRVAWRRSASKPVTIEE